MLVLHRMTSYESQLKIQRKLPCCFVYIPTSTTSIPIGLHTSPVTEPLPPAIKSSAFLMRDCDQLSLHPSHSRLFLYSVSRGKKMVPVEN